MAGTVYVGTSILMIPFSCSRLFRGWRDGYHRVVRIEYRGVSDYGCDGVYTSTVATPEQSREHTFKSPISTCTCMPRTRLPTRVQPVESAQASDPYVVDITKWREL